MIAGTLDVKLTSLGEQQAQQTAEYLKDVPFTHIYSSPLDRAYNTALPHLAYHDVPIARIDALREMDLGAWEGRKYFDLRGKDTQFDLFVTEFGTSVPPGGESAMGAGARVREAVIALAQKHPDESILIVSHAAVLRVVIGMTLGIEPSTYGEKLPFPTNASVQIMDFDGESLTLVEFSRDEHITNKTAVTTC